MSVQGIMEWTVDIDKPANPVHLGPIFEGDQDEFEVRLHMLQNGLPVSMTGATVTAYMMRADRTTVVWSGSVSSNIASVVFTHDVHTITGRVQLAVRVTIGNTKHTVFAAEGDVRRTTTDAIVDPTGVIPSLDDLLAKIAEMERATESAQTAAEAAQEAAQEASRATVDMTELANKSAAYARDIEERLDSVLRVGYVEPDYLWQMGYISESSGLILTDGYNGTRRCSTGGYIALRAGDFVACDEGYSARMYVYAASAQAKPDKVVPRGDFSAVPIVADADCFVRITARRTDNAEVTVDEIAQHVRVTLRTAVVRAVEDAKAAAMIAGQDAAQKAAAEAMGKKLDKPDAPPTEAGKVLRVSNVREDGSFACEWGDVPGADVDVTLTVEGDAADAKETGDRIRKLRDDKADKTTTYEKDEVDRIFGSLFHGGENYLNVMKAYFEVKGCATRADLTDIVEGWFKLGRNGWTGGTRFDAPDKSTVSTGTKLGDNTGMVCEPSTNTVAGRDDYAKLPLFAVTDCNWELDGNGKRRITAIKGITSGKPFVTNDPMRPVGVLQMAPWCKYVEDADGYEYWFTDQIHSAGYYPIPESVDLDGTIHSWVVHAKYGLGDACSSIANVPIRVWDISHNVQLTAIPNAFNANSCYCGKCSCDDAWIKLHVYIKYASLTLDGIMNGCCSYYNGNKHPAIAETGVKRIIVTVAEGIALLVGSTICLGTGNYGGKTAQTSVVDRRKITSIEDVEIDGTAYKAVYLDVDAAFDTTVDLYWTTMQWWTGSTDAVLGNDGSPYSNTDNKESYKLQGIEQSYGCYEVMADTILTYAAEGGVNVLTFNVCRNATQFAASVTAAYKKAGYSMTCPASNGWNYIKKLGHDETLPELMFGCLGGGSSSTYTKDACYQLNNSSGNYEWLVLGSMIHGLTHTGLSCASARYGLTGAGWDFGGRLSANGSRGEYAA